MTTSLKFSGAILVILFGLLSPKGFAQVNFRPGYVVTGAGDTLRGMIDFRKWETNPKNIRFKPGGSEEAVDYRPLSIKMFKVEDEKYVGAVVKVEISIRTTSNLNYKRDFEFRQDTTFLETLIDGEKSLYVNKLSYSNENYYIRRNGHFELLQYKRFLRDVDGQSVTAENKKFVGQLQVYFNDCPSLQKQINGVMYTRRSLKNLFEKYYACQNEEPEFFLSHQVLKVEVGVEAGAAYSTLHFRPISAGQAEDVDFPASTDLALGLIFNVTFPRGQGKWSMYNELMVHHFNFSKAWTEVEYPGNYSDYRLSFGRTNLKINLSVRYKYPVGKAFVFANAGLANTLALHTTNELLTYKHFYEIQRNYVNKAMGSSGNYEIGYLAGAGVQYNDFSLEARYETGKSIANYEGNYVHVRRIYVLLGYRF